VLGHLGRQPLQLRPRRLLAVVAHGRRFDSRGPTKPTERARAWFACPFRWPELGIYRSGLR
jgi:hypothetical protein